MASRLDRAGDALINAQACSRHGGTRGGYVAYSTASTLAICAGCRRLALLAALRVVLAEPSGASALAVEESIQRGSACYSDGVPNGAHVLRAAFAATLAELEQVAR